MGVGGNDCGQLNVKPSGKIEGGGNEISFPQFLPNNCFWIDSTSFRSTGGDGSG